MGSGGKWTTPPSRSRQSLAILAMPHVIPFWREMAGREDDVMALWALRPDPDWRRRRCLL